MRDWVDYERTAASSDVQHIRPRQIVCHGSGPSVVNALHTRTVRPASHVFTAKSVASTGAVCRRRSVDGAAIRVDGAASEHSVRT